jgi:hypothetical protein
MSFAGTWDNSGTYFLTKSLEAVSVVNLPSPFVKSTIFCVPIAAVNRYRQALALLYDPQFDAKAPTMNNKSATGATNTPGRRQTRARGMQ